MITHLRECDLQNHPTTLGFGLYMVGNNSTHPNRTKVSTLTQSITESQLFLGVLLMNNQFGSL